MKLPLREMRRRVLAKVREVARPVQALARSAPAAVTPPGQEPPVVARLVVEVRSDGTHTIAQGAIEDTATGEKVAIRAEGTTPGQLAASLARSLVSMPLMAAHAATTLRGVQRGRPAPRPSRETPGEPDGGAIDTDGTTSGGET